MIEHFELPTLSGLPETMLWSLYSRAAETRRPDSRLHDPWSTQIADAIDYDFAHFFGAPDFGHVVRAIAFDRLISEWLQVRPEGLVVALGDGLETQFHRVDNGRMRWMSVDLPEAIEVRARFLPDTKRRHNLACSAFDPRWMKEVDASRGLFVTAAGLFMYFSFDDVRRLVATIAERFPEAELAFDVVAPWLVRKTERGWYKTRFYSTPRMPWGLGGRELGRMYAWHPNVAEIRAASYGTNRKYPHAAFRLIDSHPLNAGRRDSSFIHMRCRYRLSRQSPPMLGCPPSTT